MGPAPLGGSWRRGKVAACWESPHRQENQPGQKGTFRSSEKRATTGLRRQGGWDPHIRSCHRPVPPNLRLVWLGAGTQGLEDRPRDRTAAGCPETAWRGRSVLRSQLGVFTEEADATVEARCHCEVAKREQGHHSSLLLRRLPHQPLPGPAPRPSQWWALWTYARMNTSHRAWAGARGEPSP